MVCVHPDFDGSYDMSCHLLLAANAIMENADRVTGYQPMRRIPRYPGGPRLRSIPPIV